MNGTKYLRESEKQIGRRAMVIEECINGIAYPLLGDTIVYLLAVQFHAGNMALGYISSASYIAGIVLPLVPLLFRGRNQVKSQMFCWYIRAFFCLAYLSLLHVSEWQARLILLATFTLFCVFRMIGIAFNDFTIKSISSVSNRGKVVAEVNIAYQGSSMFFRFITGLVMRLSYFMAVSGLIALQMVGVAANMISAAFVGKIPCRSTVQYTRGHGVLYQLRIGMRDEMLRRRLVLRWIITMTMVVFNMSVPFMRVESHFSQSLVMFYSVSLGLAYVCAGMVTRSTADRLGSKPLVIFSSLFAAITLVVWATIPASAPFVWFMILGFLTNFFLSSANMLCIRLVTQVMPDEDSISFNAMVNFVIALFALVAGMISGFLADKINPWFVGNGYSLVFVFALILVLVVLGLSFMLREGGSASMHDAASVVFSLRGIRAVSTMDHLSKERDPIKRRALLLDLGSNMNGMATSELREILANPFAPDTEEAIRTLGEKPRPELLDDLIRIAKDDDSYVQLDAIGALGSYVDSWRAVDTLLSLTDDAGSSVRSMACRSLARITRGDSRYLPLVNKLSRGAQHTDEEIDYLIAKRTMDQEGLFYEDFFLPVKQHRSATFRQTRYAVLASFLLFGSPRLAHLYEMMNNGDVDDFLSGFLSDARDLPAIDSHYDEVIRMFTYQDWEGVRSFCMGMLDEADVGWNHQFDHLKKGLLEAKTMDIGLFDVQDALAELYFCYSLAKNSRS